MWGVSCPRVLRVLLEKELQKTRKPQGNSGLNLSKKTLLVCQNEEKLSTEGPVLRNSSRNPERRAVWVPLEPIFSSRSQENS